MLQMIVMPSSMVMHCIPFVSLNIYETIMYMEEIKLVQHSLQD